ncbi:MAG: nickel-responsive transcriptional regulator NikR [Pseudomonadota bacterium]
MTDLNRIGIAIEAELLTAFDAYLAERQYPSRSEAFRDLIRDALAQQAQPAAGDRVVGSVTLIYDHATRQLGDRMTSLQHDHHHVVLSSMHVHLDHNLCLESIVLRGRFEDVKRVADGLIAMKGVHHGQLVLNALTS